MSQTITPIAIIPERVEFTSHGENIVGLLYRPTGLPVGAKPPVIVIAPPWLNVKEQVATRWAAALADRGIAALAFDYRNWGESGGTPRDFDSSEGKVGDLRAALAYLRSRSDTDPKRMGLLGICTGSMHVFYAAEKSEDVRSIALVASWLHDAPSLRSIYGQEEVVRRYAAAREASEKFKATGEVLYVPGSSNTDKTAGMYFPDPAFFYTNPKRGQIKQWPNRMAVMSWTSWMDMDGVAAASNVTQPLLIIHSDNSAIPDNVRKAFAAAKGPKELLWTEGEHTQFYDDPVYVAKAADSVAGHFHRTLGDGVIKQPQIGSDQIDPRVSGFFSALEAMDIPRFVELWAEDGVQEMPFAPGEFPTRLEGRAAIARQYGPLPSAFASMKFPIARVTPGADGRTVTVEYSGSIELKSGGRYDNSYVGIFTFNDAGKIQHFAEYFDPVTLVNGFPGAAAVGAPDEQRIIAAVNAVGSLADARKWPDLRAVFADNVDVDYTSLLGGQPSRVKADELIAGWKQGLGAFAKTEHVVNGHEVTVNGDTAECRARFIATHTRSTPDSTDRWTVGGRYRYTLNKLNGQWKVTGTVMTMEWEQGKR